MKKSILFILSGLVFAGGCSSKQVQNLPVQTTAPAEVTAVPVQTPTPETTSTPAVEEPSEESFDRSVYNAVLEETYEMLERGLNETDVPADELMWLSELMYMYDLPQLKKDVGYGYADINYDGTEELLIGTNTLYENENTFVYALYTVKDGEAQQVFQGLVRSSYYLLDDYSFLYYGSNGAMSNEQGHYYLSANETELTCDDFVFSQPKEEGSYEAVYYRNIVGTYDLEDSIEISEDEMLDWIQLYAVRGSRMELTSLRTYGQGAVSAEMDPKKDGWVVFTAAEDVTDFMILEIELQENNGEYTFETVAVDDAYGDLKQGETASRFFEFVGSIPGYAISYIDREGTEHRYTVNLSGYDGSVELEEY